MHYWLLSASLLAVLAIPSTAFADDATPSDEQNAIIVTGEKTGRMIAIAFRRSGDGADQMRLRDGIRSPDGFNRGCPCRPASVSFTGSPMR